MTPLHRYPYCTEACNIILQMFFSAGKYKVDRTKISTSGISSGAAMATQLHVAYSTVFMGVGMVAGSK
jgi:poly(3-hydroxybutyrate) depolymerase